MEQKMKLNFPSDEKHLTVCIMTQQDTKAARLMSNKNLPE